MIERIASPRRTKEILTKYKFVFQKKYGQNFLIDLHVLNKIIKSANIQKDDMVIEIGPGIGSLTQVLAEQAREVIAIEIDKMLIPILQDTLSDYNNIKIINEDILKVDLKKIIMDRNNGKSVKIVANLPYYITTPIVMGIFENHIPVESITVMVQKEVAERMQAKPRTKAYGALTLAVNYYSEPYIVAYVPPNCFMPRPNIGSAVISLTKHNKYEEVQNEKLLFKIIRASFKQRRKTLLNGITNQLNINKEMVIEALENMNLDPNIRGEALTLKEFKQLTNIINTISS
ncbi:MAG: 16S rRNA (adenine(1518)-N(6)/adenine(1519)-N(6))-dimethyltransferase RsmA [Eubacteriales bacterium]